MNIRNLLLSASLGLATSLAMQAGAPPTVMVLPDKTMCNEQGWGTTSERNGKTRFTEDYDKAFMSSDLKNVVVKLNDLLKTNGLPPKDFGASSEIDDDEELEEEFFEGAQTGAGMEQNSYDQLLNKLKPDIILKVGWNENKIGFNKRLSYRLEALDSYSGKSIAAVIGNTPDIKVITPNDQVLVNAAAENMNDFTYKLQSHFDDIQENGREVTLTVRILQSSPDNMNSEFNGKELNTIINEWVAENTVNHVFSERNVTRNRQQFEQCRIPLLNSAGKPMQARDWVAQLQKYLKTNYGIVAENATKGLGSGRLYIGEK